MGRLARQCRAKCPHLRLIEIDLAPTSARTDISGDIVAALAQGGVTAQVIEAPDNASGAGWAGRARAIAFWGSIAFALVMAVIISLGARSLAARRRELVTVMTDLGATRGQAAGRIADEAAILGLYAGLVGGALAGIVGLALLFVAMPGMNVENLRQMILPVDLAPIIAAPFVAALAAGAGRARSGWIFSRASREAWLMRRLALLAVAVAVIAFIWGFWNFATTVRQPAQDPPRADAIVALTGGSHGATFHRRAFAEAAQGRAAA